VVTLAVTIPVFASAPQAEIKEVILPPELQRICSCESTGRPDNDPVQFNADGTVLQGKLNSNDIGMCQINTKYWLTKSQDLGYDIYTEEGNKQMALWIYQNNGNQPWFWSKSCWN